MDYKNEIIFIHQRIYGIFSNGLTFFQLYLLFSLTIHLQAQDLTSITPALRTFQAHACDGELLHLNCKNDTVIYILFAQYGISKKQICPFSYKQNTTSLTTNALKNCTESLRYTLLKKVELTCRNKSSCSIDTSTQLLGVPDQCPSIPKYAEVAYKCRPSIFINKIACTEKNLDLNCPAKSKILIFSAMFGTLQNSPSKCINNTVSSHLLKTPQIINKKPFKQECQAKQVKKIINDRCHTQSNCSIKAQFDQFQIPDCADQLTVEEQKTQVHLKIAYACLSDELLLSSFVSTSVIDNSSKNHKYQNKTKDTFLKKTFDNFITIASTMSSTQKINFSEPVEDQLFTEFYFDSSTKTNLFVENVLPTDIDNLASAVLSNKQSSWSNKDQSNELPSNFKTHISNQPTSWSNTIKSWNSISNFIENNLERLLVYLLVTLCIALLACFVFLGISHISEKKKTETQSVSLDCSLQEDCCDSKPDLSNSISLNKNNHVSSVFSGFEEDNPTVEEIIGELHRNGSFIGISQQLSAQLAQQQFKQQNDLQCNSLQNQMLLSATAAAAVVDSTTGLFNCHPINNSFTSTFSPAHHSFNSEKINLFQNTMYHNQLDPNSPQKLTSVPHSNSFYDRQIYTPIYTSNTNQAIVGTFQQHHQQPNITFQQPITPQNQIICSEQPLTENRT